MTLMYGPGETSVEQINNTTGTVTYLHHDQQGSMRLLTGSTGKTEGSYSYSAYGTPEHTGTATTPLGSTGNTQAWTRVLCTCARASTTQAQRARHRGSALGFRGVSNQGYAYGRHEVIVEQINGSTGTAQYRHHGQQGSTRLLTGSTGKVEGKCSYLAYGTPTCEGTATTHEQHPPERIVTEATNGQAASVTRH
jgi:hypothetical protein